MPSWCAANFLWQSVIIFIIYFIQIISTNYHDQVLRADVGQDMTLSCLFDEEKIEQVSFMRQMTGDILSLGPELFVHQIPIELKQFSSNRLDLKFLSVKQNDSGLYSCMYNDEKISSFLVEILVPPSFVSYSPLEGSISLTENSSMSLSCHAYAIPPVNITWIYKNKEKQIKNIHDGEDLYIPYLQSEDSGLYECIASNKYHASISRSFYVTIQYSPRVLIINERIRNALHETVLVKCRVCAVPQVKRIYWFRDDRQITEENIQIKTKITDEQCSESMINIVDIGEHQFGQYECRGENSVGQNSDWIHIRQILRIRKTKEKVYSEEINRNERTALLIDKSQKKKKNQTIESTNFILFSHSIISRSSWLCFLILFSIHCL